MRSDNVIVVEMDFFSARLVLHPFSLEEAERVIQRVPSSEDVWDPNYPLEDELDPLRSFVRDVRDGVEPGPFSLYAIRYRAGNVAIGGIGFFGPPDESGAVEIGYGLVPSARGKGIATEALVAALGIARQHGALMVKADTNQENPASQRVLRGAGFAQTGRAGEQTYYSYEI